MSGDGNHRIGQPLTVLKHTHGMDHCSDQVDAVQAKLSSLVQQLMDKTSGHGWEGPDADRFLQEFQDFEPSIGHATSDLRAHSGFLRRKVHLQIWVSST